MRYYVLYDGECAFCNKSVMLILKKDKKQNIYVCSNSSKKGKALIKQYEITESLDATIIFIKKDKVFYRSTAVLQISKQLKGGYPFLSVFLVVPVFLRDWVYNFIAKYRKLIVRKSYTCEWTTDEQLKKRILN